MCIVTVLHCTAHCTALLYCLPVLPSCIAVLYCSMYRPQVALDAAEAGEQYPLYIKLTNNMGAVLRKQELHEEVGQHVDRFRA